MVNWCNGIIRWSFYLLFFCVPLFFAGDTSELFELNKIWLTWWITIVILCAWLCKMICERRFSIQRTFFDIPLLLFLLSQIISSIMSLDPYVSFWGYYSRFNGGLLSTITYIVLYYALVSNLKKQDIVRIMWISFSSCVLVAFWGLPSHFYHDPTCYVFRGTFDVSCWTSDFAPQVRMFSTLGQPDWLAAYLCVLLPFVIIFSVWKIAKELPINATYIFGKYPWRFVSLLILSGLFYFDLVYTNTRAGFAAFWVGFFLLSLGMFLFPVFKRTHTVQLLGSFFIVFLVLTFFTETPFDQLNGFLYSTIMSHQQSSMTHTSTPSPTITAASLTPTPTPKPAPSISSGSSITDSGKIRLYVWQGAIDIWKAHPIFGSGVETFAFAYYLYRPVGHNLTSEWDFLYNKAHNEYLNYLATTGLFGLGTYLAYILVFFIFALLSLFRTKPGHHGQEVLFVLGILTAYVTLLITNFFGFSVVIINLYIFLFPAFFLVWTEMLQPKQILVFGNPNPLDIRPVGAFGWCGIIFVILVGLYYEILLITYWNADKQYAMGHNLDSVNQFVQANSYLTSAVALRPDEPVFQDELSINEGALASGYLQNKDVNDARKYAYAAKNISDQLTQQYPNNLLFFKSRARLFYLISQGNQQILSLALAAIQRANQLAPTDAKVLYNLGVLYAQTGDIDDGIATLEKTVQYKPDYTEAYYALGLFYHEKAVDKNGKVINPAEAQKAVQAMEYILNNLDSNNADAKKALKDWGV